MPQNPLPDVIFATLLQRYEFFLNYARKTAIIFSENGSFFTFSLFHFWHLHFRKLLNGKLYYYILYIIYNNNHTVIQKTKKSNVKSEKLKNWKSSILKRQIYGWNTSLATVCASTPLPTSRSIGSTMTIWASTGIHGVLTRLCWWGDFIKLCIFSVGIILFSRKIRNFAASIADVL